MAEDGGRAEGAGYAEEAACKHIPWQTHPRKHTPQANTPRNDRATSASPRCVKHGYGGHVQQFAARRSGCLSWRPLNATQGLSRCATGAPRHPRWCALFWLAGIGVEPWVEPNGNAKPNDDRQLGVPVALASWTR